MNASDFTKSLSVEQLAFVRLTQSQFDNALAAIQQQRAALKVEPKLLAPLDAAINAALALTSDARTARLQADCDRAQKALEAHQAVMRAV